MEEVRLLVTGATAPGFVSIVNALRQSNRYIFHIIGTDYRLEMSSSHFADEVYQLPDNFSPEFPDALLKLCKEKEVQVVLPIRTDDQLPICHNLEKFRQSGVEPAIVVTNPEILDVMLNKRSLLEYCRDVIQMETPAFKPARSALELRGAVSDLGYPDSPVAIKPSYSKGSRGFRILTEKRDWRKAFFEEKPAGIYSTVDRVIEEIGNEFPELIAMEYLPGKEYTLDVLCRKGVTFSVLPRLRTGMAGGITTKGVLTKDENYESLSSIASMIVEGFGASYNLGLQLKEDKDGIPRILEINPRLQGTTIISVVGGVNIPELMVQMALRDFDYDTSFEVRWGLQMQRVWLELFGYEEEIWTRRE